MKAIIRYHIAEFLLICCIITMSFDRYFIDPWAVIAIATVVLMAYKKISFLGISVGVMMLCLAVILFFAAISEYQECIEANYPCHEVMVGGILLTSLLLFIACILIYKYGYEKLKGLIGE